MISKTYIFQSWLQNLVSRGSMEGVALTWFSSYLSTRKQKVLIDCDAQSNYHEAITCVPQASILVPLLFILYPNDLTEVVNRARDITPVIVNHSYKQVLSNNILTDSFSHLTTYFLLVDDDISQLLLKLGIASTTKRYPCSATVVSNIQSVAY